MLYSPTNILARIYEPVLAFQACVAIWTQTFGPHMSTHQTEARVLYREAGGRK